MVMEDTYEEVQANLNLSRLEGQKPRFLGQALGLVMTQLIGLIKDACLEDSICIACF
jgi:hypothetical protein